MIPSTALYTTRQESLARFPVGKVLIKDYAQIIGASNDDEINIIGGSAQVGLATKFTAPRDMTVDNVKLFIKADGATNDFINVEIREASGTVPQASAIANGTGKILAFSEQSISYRKAFFKDNFTLSSGQDYFIVANTAGSAYSYFWAEDEDYTSGSWAKDTGNDGSWDIITSGKSFIAKITENNQIETGLITSTTSSGSSGTIFASAASWDADQWKGYMCEITASGASGSQYNTGMRFAITSNTVSSLATDLEPDTRGVVAGDSFYIENLNNFVEIREWTDGTINDFRNRTINTSKINIFNQDDKFFDNQPFGDTLKEGNDVIIQIGFSGTELLNQFRGYIESRNVQTRFASITIQDIMGKLQRFPVNLNDVGGINYEQVIHRICQRRGVPFISDLTGISTSATVSFNDQELALDIANEVRESLGWRLYGDQYGRVRFKDRQNAAVAAFTLSESDFIVYNGLKNTQQLRNTINIISATNVTGSLTYAAETLLSSFAGSAANDNLTVNFASAGAYSNIRWEDTTNDGSVYIEEQGSFRDTGEDDAGTGSVRFTVKSISGTPDYDINIYGSKVTLTGNQFFVEKVSGESQNEVNINVPKTVVKNKLFKNAGNAADFCEEIMFSNGKPHSIPTVRCRGVATLEIDDAVNAIHPNVSVVILFKVIGQVKTISHGSFMTEFSLEDTLIRIGDYKYDTGLFYDTGWEYDSG